jgi:hypothetical protein
MKQYLLYIFLVLILLIAGCGGAESEIETNTKKNPISQPVVEQEELEKITPNTNDSVQTQHLSGADSSTSKESPESIPHVSGSSSPAQATHTSGQ